MMLEAHVIGGSAWLPRWARGEVLSQSPVHPFDSGRRFQALAFPPVGLRERAT
jgi:hypothetical protein